MRATPPTIEGEGERRRQDFESRAACIERSVMARRNTTRGSKRLTRHLVSINDLSNSEIESIFDIAKSYLNELGDPQLKYRIGRGKRIASDYILATLFFEPSTRTRLSFESAMLRLGGSIITSADPATSSAAK